MDLYPEQVHSTTERVPPLLPLQTLGTTLQDGPVQGVSNSGSASTTVSMTQSRSLTANFTLKSYALSLSAGSGGSVSGAGSFNHGTSPTIVATPYTGYDFTGWSGVGVTNSSFASTTVSMTEARSLTANFSLKSYTLSLTAGSGGNRIWSRIIRPRNESHHCRYSRHWVRLYRMVRYRSLQFKFCQHYSLDDRGTVIDRKLFSQILHPFSHCRFSGPIRSRIIRPRNESHHCRYSRHWVRLYRMVRYGSLQFKFCQHYSLDDRGTVIDRKLFSQVLYPFSHRRFRGNRFWGWKLQPWTTCNYTSNCTVRICIQLVAPIRSF